MTGWLADESDFEALATRVVELLEDDELRTAAGRAARERAITRMGLELSIETTVRLLAQLAAQRKDPRRFGALQEAARPIRANGSAVKAATAAATAQR